MHISYTTADFLAVTTIIVIYLKRDGQRLQEHQTRYVSECVQEQKENTACDRAVESLSLHASPDLDRLLIKRTRLQGIAAKLTWDFLHLTS